MKRRFKVWYRESDEITWTMHDTVRANNSEEAITKSFKDTPLTLDYRFRTMDVASGVMETFRIMIHCTGLISTRGAM